MVGRNKHFCSSTTTTETNKVSMNFRSVIRGVSRTAATSKIELFVIIVNGFQRLTIITMCSIMDVAVDLDPPLKKTHFRNLWTNNGKAMIKSEAATRGVLLKNVFLEIWQNSQENTCARTWKKEDWQRETLAEVFSCEFCEISNNTFSTEHLQATASVKWFCI